MSLLEARSATAGVGVQKYQKTTNQQMLISEKGQSQIGANPSTKQVYTNVVASPSLAAKTVQATNQEDKGNPGTGNATNELTLENKSSATKHDMADELDLLEQPSELTIVD